MKIKFIDSQIPFNYSTPCLAPDLEPTKEYNSRTYTLLGKSEKTYTLRRRLWLGLRGLARTILSLRFFRLNETIKQDWQSFWTGRTAVVVYSSYLPFVYEMKAQQGDANAQFKLGTFYHKAEEFQNYQKAIEYYLLAANQGHPLALCGLGTIYREGLGVEKNDRKAFEYFQAAANKGEVHALIILGDFYLKGNGVEKNDHQAFVCYQTAANQGHVSGWYAMALMYEKGRGVTQDAVEALRLYRLAADQDYEPARLRLQQLSS